MGEESAGTPAFAQVAFSRRPAWRQILDLVFGFDVVDL